MGTILELLIYPKSLLQRGRSRGVSVKKGCVTGKNEKQYSSDVVLINYWAKSERKRENGRKSKSKRKRETLYIYIIN
jgi:hypothetical protein